MKLKYYLRGLAVGVLLTTIVLTIANAGNRPLTDAQIRQRALELGMVEIDSIRLSALQGEDPSDSESALLDDMSESSLPESDMPESDMSVETSQSSEKEDKSTEVSPQQETSSEPEPVIFQVKSGAGSSSVSRDLAAAGLIEDAAAFDTFLCNNGYSKKIRIGTYEILPGTSEEDIAKIITQQS